MTRPSAAGAGRRLVVARVAQVALLLGIALQLFLTYRVLQVGGFTTTSVRAACAQAATGRASATYRLSEDVTVDRDFWPLRATCRWSGGTSDELLALGGWSWVGPALVGTAVLVLVGLQVAGRSAGPTRRVRAR